MTHQNHQTNGASLEDCHTNFFALTELCGIKWRRLVWGESGGAGGGEEGGAPLEDPVISSYARCLAGDILCVWRRVAQPPPPVENIYEIPAPATPPPLSLRAAKELWIFWYGEEPDLNGLVAPELIASQGEQGSWDSGLTYECRSLLFKALHNLIERCLLSRDFVRLGKWFVQPYDGDEEDVGKSPWHLSFSFAFFLHGESTVCASVDVRQHPPVRTLTARRLRAMRAGNAQQQQVMLSPFALSGRLTGRQWADSDADTGRLLEQWRALYPLPRAEPAVEVVCGGVRMRYPRAYVLLADDEGAGGGAGGGGGGGTAGGGLAERALRALAAPLPHQPPEVCYADAVGDCKEDYLDPTRKTPCCCNKCRRRRPRHSAPFHRRHYTRHKAGGSCSPGSGGGGSPAAAGSAPPSAGAPPASPHAHHAAPPLANLQAHAAVPTTLHTPAPTPDPLAPPTPAPPSATTTKLFQGDSPGGAAPAGLSSLLRRPLLPAEPPRAPDADHRHLSMLYDYSTVHAWLEHPVKRFKPSSASLEDLALGGGSGDLYADQRHASGPPPPAPAPHPPPHHNDNDHDDVKDYKNLFTSDGLCPTLKDLDQIFDNSDDASGDETVRLMQVSTPPETKCTLEERCGGRCVRAEELSKMFPTPPSMEAHAQPSPGLSLPDEPASPPPDPIDDWSYVFRPQPLAKYVGSSKYAPLAQLPSQSLPALALAHDAVYRPRWQPAEPAPAPPPPPPPAASQPSSQAGEVKSVPRTAPAPPPPPPPAAPPPRPACPLLVNVLLGDTLLNLFRDHNFNSCTLCVCNAGSRVVGNIRGADAVYLPDDDNSQLDDDPPSCSCGFSAVVNRRLAHRAGLFYEDELEITGAAEEPGAGAGAGGPALAALVAAAAHAAPGAGPACLLARAARARDPPPDHINMQEFADGGAAAAKALAAAGGGGASAAANGTGGGGVHRWPFLLARAPRSSRDVLRLMRRLRPLLQDVITKRCCGARMWDGVSGPLTWRQFHRLAGRGNEDLCEPQPVPHLLVGHDTDWLSLSPYAVRHWDRLALEPYGYPRDVSYLVLAPAAPALEPPVRAFFRDVSAAYEAARLGRHRPLARLAREGLLRAAGVGGARADDWAGELPAGRLGDHLRGYAAALRALVPQLNALTLDRGALDEPDDDEPAPPAPPAADEEGGAPALVLYVVEPPAAAADPKHSLLALLTLADHATRALEKHNPLFKLVSVDGVQEWWGGECSGAARALAFGVYGGLRRGAGAGGVARSLTGFGPAAAAAMAKQPPWNLRAPALVLSGGRRDAEWGGSAEAGAVLLVAYCLSHDQRWLLAAATDARGELLDTIAINILVPPRSRRRRWSAARRLGLTKLMDFILGVMSQLAQPWRLVVGRLGRIGHGELKGWSWLLSRKNLVVASGMLREMCGACAAVGGAVAVTSACLVSTEPDHQLRLMPDRFTPDERFSTHSHLSTPRDVTATHILVFPTSATTQSNPLPFEAPLANGDDQDMMFLGVDINMADEDMGEDNMTDLIINDMFSNLWGGHTSPRRDNEEPDEERGARGGGGGAGGREPGHHDHVGTLLQQPLALGYLVSTAPLANMPRWWCGSGGACPAFLKSALHVHAACVHAADDLAQIHSARDHAHPLDSQLTTDVLRYVLERYNALSWLTLDARSSDRASCLPLHMQALLQLYHTAAALP